MLTLRANPEHLQAAASEIGMGTTPITTPFTTQQTLGTAQETEGTAQETAQETQGTAQETTQDRVLALLRVKPAITRRELADRIGLSDSGIKYQLAKMKAAGMIRHIGPTKAGYWEVLK